MRQCPVDKLKPGMFLARPVYDHRYRKLLAEGVKLDISAIWRMQEMGFRQVFIAEEGTEDVVVNDLVGVRTRQLISKAMETLVNINRRPEEGEEDSWEREDPREILGPEYKRLVHRATTAMLQELMDHREPIYSPGTYLAKDQLISHSTNVAILSALIGLGFGFGREDLHLLSRAALFHDIGKLRLDPALTDIHPLDMDEDQHVYYNMHPQMGAVLLEQDVTNNLHITMGVLQHHENQDGSGFPEGLEGSGEPPRATRQQRGTIHRFAEIVAVANYFDNAVSGYLERNPLNPMDAAERLLEKTPDWFNPHIVQMALSVVSVLPEGSNVEIRDSRHYQLIGFRGVVARVNPKDLKRPTVALLYNSRRQRLPKPQVIDFSDDDRLKVDFLYDLSPE